MTVYMMVTDDELELPATYGYALRKYCGVSVRAFKKEFGISVDEALEIAQSRK